MVYSPLGKEYIGLLGQSSSFISAFNVAQVCLTWFVFTYTHSATAVGTVAIVESLAVLLVSLPVGTLVDRLNKGLLLTVSGAMGALVFAILTVISNLLIFNLYIIMALAAVWGASREISRSTAFAALPDLVGQDSLSGANGLFRALNSSLGSISNAAAGGLIVALGVAAGFAFSSGAYLLSALLAAFIIFPFLRKHHVAKSGRADKRQSMMADLKEGLHWLTGTKGFFLLTVSATFFNFFIDMTITFYVIYIATGVKASSLIYGLVLSALAGGDVIGSLIPGRLNLLKYTGKISVLAYGGVSGILLLILGIFPSAVNAIVFTFIIGISLGISVNVWLTSAHNLVPREMRGRYFALDGVLSSISPAAIAVGAFVINSVGILQDFIVSGALLLVATVAFSSMRSLWRLDGSLPPQAVHSETIGND